MGGFPCRERAARSAKLAADPARFFPGLPSVSYDDPAYRSGEYWRGPQYGWMGTLVIEFILNW